VHPLSSGASRDGPRFTGTPVGFGARPEGLEALSPAFAPSDPPPVSLFKPSRVMPRAGSSPGKAAHHFFEFS